MKTGTQCENVVGCCKCGCRSSRWMIEGVKNNKYGETLEMRKLFKCILGA